MLLKWRKQVREGVLRGTGRDLTAPPPREIQRLQELERAHALLREEHELLKKGHPVLFRRKQDIFAFIATQAGTYTVTRLCVLYGVTRAGYYAWRRRGESQHAEQDRRLRAVRRRRPAAGVIFHSDRGSEYLAVALRERLHALGIQQGSAQRGPEDNPRVESFFHSLKAELIHGTRFESVATLRRALRRYIAYYNRQRQHSALGYRSPVDYEARAA